MFDLNRLIFGYTMKVNSAIDILKLLLRYVSVVIIVLSFKSANGVIRPGSQLSIINGQGFVAYLDVGKGFGTIRRCWCDIPGYDRIEIILNSTTPITTARGERITPFAKTICGVRVDKISPASIGNWLLQTENFHEEFAEGSVKISVLTAPKTKFDTKITASLGKGSISCSQQQYTKYCKIINPVSGDAWDQCSLSTIIRNGSTFICRTMSWGTMDESVETIIIEAAPSTVYSEASVEETDEHYVLRCAMRSATVHTCRAEMPDRITQVYIMDGLSNGRYSSYDTTSSQSRCALQLPKPLAPHEHGLWKIQNSDATQKTGCLFYIGEQGKDAIIKEELKRQQEHNNRKRDEVSVEVMSTTYRRKIELYSTESTIPEIICNVPFVVDDCYLRDPRNTIYFPENFKFGRSRALGVCTFNNIPSTPGIWSCGLHGSDYKGYVVQDIEVVVESMRGRVVNNLIRISGQDFLELMCRAPFNEPISRCAFVDPSNQVHLVASTFSGIVSTGHVQYFGEGIEKGFCGVRIKSVHPQDFGEWICQFQISGAGLSNFTIMVERNVISHASAYGLGFGLAAAVLFLAGVFVVGYKRRRRAISPSVPQEQVNMEDLE